MSNNHVLANVNKASLQDPILQPGPYDLGLDLENYSAEEVEQKYKEYIVAYLSDFVPLNFSCWLLKKRVNEVDVAIAKLAEGIQYSNNILGIGVPNGVNDPNVGDIVQKSGRTTGVTQGRIIDTSATIVVEYPPKTALFENVMVIEPTDQFKAFSEPGDSGSPIVNANGNLIGVIFAGGNGYGIGFPIKKAFMKFGVSLA